MQERNRDRLLSTREAAELLCVPENTLRWWRHIGTGPECFRLGRRRVVYRESKARAWLADQEAAGDKRPDA
ncbi:helix-turn-helix transcriptional regulator [Myceligenerans pegani]|uniref:Helix-turn-helix domain-containing protein n=1 Tax=Myceligenerans pegani TaxID=2776917 RepID=A0ABR9MXK6_9MICO|nr:helix-turn-helix domain-containing protein [Myceligenerans sp. TRM 65318]MBE1876120.1 helix-turn-helix domain-containing protein [Myceligenerans sp. TRM 65318]MBE3018391.1 helix-turn-helix domain-containing protein [Myceligenerans sp. TRM 65318]